MKKFLLITSLLASSCSWGAVLPPLPTLTVDGQTFLNPVTTLKVLYFAVTSGTSGHATPRTMNGTSGYQVPGGKTYTFLALRCSNGGAADALSIGYNDIDVGMATNTNPTNLVSIGGSSVLPTISTPISSQQNVTDFSFGSGFSIPTGKYLIFQNGNSSTLGCAVFGTEQ